MELKKGNLRLMGYKAFFMVLLSSLFLNVSLIVAAQKNCNKKRIILNNTRTRDSAGDKIAGFITELVNDAARINVNLFSLTSVKILTAFTPLYVASRMVDEKLQCNFHDITYHKNINQFPKSCHQIARYGVGIPMVALSSLAIFASDEDLRLTARMFALGLPFVQSGKDIIKNLKCNACLRPWHQDFSIEKRSSGGFPSGHTANVVFMATLFGMRHGLKWGIPLGLFGVFVMVDFINCNRHYLSQIVAGAGLGLLFAFAASTVVDQKLSESWCIAPDVDSGGAPVIKLTYAF